jgi:hypothetical protein
VGYSACIVFRQSGVQVVGDARVEMLSGKALKNVDIFHDMSASAKAFAFA